jgi:predicted HTH domain antitoxin
MPTVSVNISDDILHTLNENESEMARMMKLYTAMQLYREHKLSLGQASELSEMHKDEFMRERGRHDIPVIDYSPEDLHKELLSFS